MRRLYKKYSYYKLIIYSLYKRFILNLNPDINIGSNTIIEPGARLFCQYGGSITIGDNCYISQGAQLLTHGGNISIGHNSTVNPYTVIYGQGGTSIGNNVRIAAHCCIVPSNHIFSDISKPIYLQGLSKLGIVIEDDVWLGTGVKVLDGIRIRKGSVVGANAVLTKSTNEFSINIGIPAKEIKNRKKS